jgi:hypothetical protein
MHCIQYDFSQILDGRRGLLWPCSYALEPADRCWRTSFWGIASYFLAWDSPLWRCVAIDTEEQPNKVHLCTNQARPRAQICRKIIGSCFIIPGSKLFSSLSPHHSVEVPPTFLPLYSLQICCLKYARPLPWLQRALWSRRRLRLPQLATLRH